ncbi:glucan endo-1,3-beta-D-glucosidase-like [Aristolochia californica]|uniref:glucan endo-1,3-beta-D-glucosidase-like n=1 Tax=Aristolochia californica TaxID=171875 RepID=UPI0035D6EFDF
MPSLFLFPEIQSQVLPDPAQFFSPHLLSSPLPTNSFFQNFALNNGDQPVYVQPYLVKSSNGSLSVCFPLFLYTLSLISQTFSPDLIVSTITNSSGTSLKHVITSYDDLSVTLRLPPDLTFYLVRGSPYLTVTVDNPTRLSISTIRSFLSVATNPSFTKHTIILSNNQTWLLYSSSPLYLLSSSESLLISKQYSGVIRLAVLPSPEPVYQTVLDRYSSRYPISGTAKLTRPFCLQYEWKKKGSGELLLLAHPLHVQLLSDSDHDVKILDEFKFDSIDGALVGVVAEKWSLETDPISATWHSLRGIDKKSCSKIIEALSKDVESLNSNPIATNASYFYGKAIARAARLALIAEEVRFQKVIPIIRKFLIKSITPWLDGSFKGNGFFYDPKWGGIVTLQGSLDSQGDFGFGIYNDHHYHLGYFLYAIAVLGKIDPAWGRKYNPQAYSMMEDFMNSGRGRYSSSYTKLRSFDNWMLHSWASGLTEFTDGRNQESTSEALNGYYSAALMGLSYGDNELVELGSSLAAFEMRAAQQWWHVKEGSPLYKEFGRDNRVMGVLWSTKRDGALWFAPPEWKECRLGIQVLPILPITEVLFSDIEYAKELVNWALPALKREGVGEGWKGFVYALQALYDKNLALKKINKLDEFDDGNSLSNLLWWVHSRGIDEKFF